MAQVAIIGAGISGLSAAYWIAQAGHDVTVFEESDRPGGVIQTTRGGGYLFEAGPNSFLDNTPDTMELCASLGLNDELEKQPLRENARFIFLNGQLHQVPLGPGGLITTGIVSRSAKFRLFKEPFVAGNRTRRDESLADFIRRRFGAEILDHVVTPFISGVYAGDPEKLSLQATFPSLYDLERDYGSILGGMIRKMFSGRKTRPAEGTKKRIRGKHLCSFRSGMAALPNRIAERLGERVHYSTKIISITRAEKGFQVHTESEDWDSAVFDAVLLAVPAYELSHLLRPYTPEPCAYLSSIPHNRLTVVALGCSQSQVRHACKGFGFLVPRNQGVRILGCIWSSSIFTGRAPQDHHAFTIFVGGSLDPAAFDLTDSEIREQVQIDLDRTFGARGPFAEERLTRWERAIPQYPVGHVQKIRELRAQCAETPGLFFTGNYLDGVSTNDCIRNARNVTGEITKYLTS